MINQSCVNANKFVPFAFFPDKHKVSYSSQSKIVIQSEFAILLNVDYIDISEFFLIPKVGT